MRHLTQLRALRNQYKAQQDYITELVEQDASIESYEEELEHLTELWELVKKYEKQCYHEAHITEWVDLSGYEEAR